MTLLVDSLLEYSAIIVLAVTTIWAQSQFWTWYILLTAISHTLISVGTTRSNTARASDSEADLITFSSILIAARFIGHSAMSLSGFKMLMQSFVLMTRASTVVHSSVALSTWTSLHYTSSQTVSIHLHRSATHRRNIWCRQITSD